MSKPLLTFDVFQQSVNILRQIPRTDTETQKAYYERLQKEYGVKPSRPVLQLIEKSMVGNEDVQFMYQKYREFTRERSQKRREKEKLEKLMAQNANKANELLQQFEQFEYQHPCPCLESAYLFLRDECQNVQITNGLLTVTMEVSKWESLF